MEAKEIYDVNSLATVHSGYHMQLDKTLRIFFQCCQDFPEILYENTLIINMSRESQNRTFFF